MKGIKSKILADYICSDNKEIVIMTNKVTTSSNLNIVEKYMKELNDVNLNDIMSPKLSQSKFYLNILDILYFIDNTNLSVIFDIIERVIKITYIFNNIYYESRPFGLDDKVILYRVYTRELNGELCTRLSTFICRILRGCASYL